MESEFWRYTIFSYRNLLKKNNMEYYLKEQFVAVLQLLCLPYEQQSTYYPAYIYTPEAIISAIYDDMLEYKDMLLEDGFLNNEVYVKVNDLQKLINNFVDAHGPDISVELFDSQDWKNIMASAKNILLVMGYPLDSPNRKWVHNN